MEIKELAKKLGLPETQFSKRSDGRIEWICDHGVGHTVWYPEGSSDTHGCDGCCSRLKKI